MLLPFGINDLFHSSCGQGIIYQLHFDLSSKKLLAKAKSNTRKNLAKNPIWGKMSSTQESRLLHQKLIWDSFRLYSFAWFCFRYTISWSLTSLDFLSMARNSYTEFRYTWSNMSFCGSVGGVGEWSHTCILKKFL